MNIQKAHSVILALDKEFQDLKIIPLLQNLQTTLNASLAQRTPQAGQAFEDSKQQLLDAISKCPSNHFVPSKHYILKTIGGDLVTGKNLHERIENILGANALAPGKVVEELQKILTEVTSFQSLMKTLLTSFKKLNIPTDELAPGNCEIGVLIPIQPELQNLENELRDLNQHMKSISEVVLGKHETVKIRALSSGSPIEVFLESTPVVALAVVTAIERIVALYKTILEIRIAKKKLEELSVPKDTVSSIEQHEKSMITAELNKIGDDIFKGYKGKDTSRKNELRTALSKALKYLAEKIDKGVDFEVSAPADSEVDVAGKEPETPGGTASHELKETLSLINAKGASLRMIENRSEGVLSISHEGKKSEDEKSKG